MSFYSLSLSLLVSSCNKNIDDSTLDSDAKGVVIKSDTLVSLNQSSQSFQLHGGLIDSLIVDPNFIRLYEIDQTIFDLSNDTAAGSQPIQVTDEMIERCKELTSKQELELFLESSGIENAQALVNLFDEKVVKFIELDKSFPNLKYLSQSDLAFVLRSSYSQLDNTLTARKPGCKDACCRAYVNDMADCDDAFTLKTVETVGVAIVGLGVGGPLGFGAVVFGGIGTGFLEHKRCSKAAVRDYKECISNM